MADRERTFSNLQTFRQKSPLIPVTTSILKTSLQEDEIIGQGIPGVKFRQKHASAIKTEEIEVSPNLRNGSLKKSMEKLSVMTKTKTSSYLHAGIVRIIKMNFWKEMQINVYNPCTI